MWVNRFGATLTEEQSKVTLLLFIALLAISCSGEKESGQRGRVVTDATGRIVHLPDTIHSVIALKSGTMRLFSYLGVTDRVSHIEGSEQRRQVPYLFAHPELRRLPVIGAGNHYDPELLAAAETDLIVATFMPGQEAERLQRLSRKPVLLVDYGDLGEGRERLYASLRLLGDVFHREERAEALVHFMEDNLQKCGELAAQAVEEKLPAYVGGVAYNGAHGITSTEPDYPPFRVLAVPNVAGNEGSINNRGGLSHETLFIDPEQLIVWNPGVLFLDTSGEQIWEKEIGEPLMVRSLAALRENRTWTVLPYNWNTTNYENLLCNTWYIGSVLMPSAFGHIDYLKKSREIFLFFHGRDIWDEVENWYRPFRHLRQDPEE